jgi:hypothetical protein
VVDAGLAAAPSSAPLARTQASAGVAD